MKKIKINVSQYPEDCERIQKVLESKGYEASWIECETLWKAYSESMAARWMCLPDEDYMVFNAISFYIKN